MEVVVMYVGDHLDHSCVNNQWFACTSSVTHNIITLLQVPVLAMLALLLTATGGSDMSLQYMFVIYVGIHQSEVYKLDCQSGRSWE